MAEQPDKAKILLFTNKSLLNPLILSASNLYKGRAVIGVISSTQTDAVQKFQITKFPDLI